MFSRLASLWRAAFGPALLDPVVLGTDLGFVYMNPRHVASLTFSRGRKRYLVASPHVEVLTNPLMPSYRSVSRREQLSRAWRGGGDA